jgi:hypothetical protein
MAKVLDSDQKDDLISSDPSEKIVDNPQYPSTLIIEDLQIGVRKFRVAHPRTSVLSGFFNARTYIAGQLLILVRLATDIVKVSPHYVLVLLFCRLWSSVNDTLEMYLSNRLLRLVCLTVYWLNFIPNLCLFF